eukprot:scaffold37639_cov184-Skeletonema_marinoi.AAC.3
MAALLTQVAAQMIILYPLAGVDGAEELAAFALCTRTHIMSLEGSIVTWFDIASKDFSREMFQSDAKENNFLIIKLTENFLPIDAYHIVL